MSSGIRASAIPSNVKKTIQNIKEITGNHSDDEIYAMLKECCMDPNETAQKLLLQDTFHEVKRRRDRKKENQTKRETVDLRWRSGPLGRGGRGNYSSRYEAQDAGVERDTASRKDNGVNQASEKADSISSPAVVQEAKSTDAGSSVTVMVNGPVGVVSGGTKSMQTSEVPSESVIEKPEMSSQRQSHIGASKRSIMTSVGRDARGKMSGKFHGAWKNQAAEVSQPSLSTPGSSSSSRPSSNYGSRPQLATGSQKVGPNKEWKPKPTNTNTVQGNKPLAACDGANISAETGVHTSSVQSTTDSEEATNKLQKELEHLHVKDMQHVIIPNHIHVSEAVRAALNFGSFDSAFDITSNRLSEPENQKNSKPNFEIHQGGEDAVEEPAMSQNALTPAEDANYVDNSQSTKQVPENMSSDDGGATSSSMPDLSDTKKETASGPQDFSVHPSASYNIGLMPAALSNPLESLEGSENQTHDVSRVPSYVVQQPVDPSIYTQIYRSGTDNDGCISPFPSSGVATKYNGNVAVLSARTSLSPPEGGNSLVLSTAAQTPLATQATGVMPSSMAVTQQPMPLFRQPPGVHFPHYPPNYIPYGHYFSPFYVPPPGMHQFLGNHAFPHQAQTGSVYPGQPAAVAAATAVKFPLSQYKPGSIPVGGSFGSYGAPPAGYASGSATTVGNTTANEDLAASQFKESNMYITGQQSEGSAVWIPATGREISSLGATSFYNHPPLPQGQHVTFASTQAGQGTFPNIYHPAQAVPPGTVHPLLQQSQPMPGAVDMAGSTSGFYQQPQHPQMNWPNNY